MNPVVKQAIPAIGLTRIEAVRLMSVQNEAFLKMLRDLSSEQWTAKTDCDPWTVKDIAAHVTGWAEAFGSVGEFSRQLTAGLRRKKELGNLTDAVNQTQVEDRAGLSPAQIMERLERALPRFERFRRRAGVVGRVIPIYEASLLGRTNLAYLMNTIYTRDVFMHRIDISRATSTQLELGRREQRLVEDVLADWGRRTGADAAIELEGPAGGSYLLGRGSSARIEGDAVEMMRVLGGRGRVSSLRLSGDVPAAEAWLGKGCPF